MNLMEIAFLVLDEADRMFDMGFYPDLRKLIKAVPPADRRQTMLFSATLNAWVKNLAWEYTKNPFEIAIEPETVTVEEVEQVLYHVSSTDKMKLLLGILKREDPESAIIFCNTKRYAEIVAKRLRLNGFDCEFIMGDLPQPKRLKIIDNIKAGKLRLLVATDVAARGLDIEDLALVVNYDLPNEAENYVHRIGRTARAGKTGKAIALSSEQDVYQLPAIERYIGRKIPSENATGELLTEDQSEGKHIKTDNYEDRSEGRSGRRRQGSKTSTQRAPREDSGAEGPKRRSSGAAERSKASRKEPEEGLRSRRKEQPSDKPMTQEKRNGRAKRRDAEQASPSKFAAQNVKLSELTLEERMAYYKEKYDKSGSSKTTYTAPSKSRTQKDSGEGEKQRGKTRKRQGAEGSAELQGGTASESRDAPPARSRSKAGGKKAVAEKRPERSNRRKTGKPQAGQEQSTESLLPEQAAPKKGILSKFLGLFKKDKTE
jgi:ATP-dependent RNA helicase RhlB